MTINSSLKLIQVVSRFATISTTFGSTNSMSHTKNIEKGSIRQLRTFGRHSRCPHTSDRRSEGYSRKLYGAYTLDYHSIWRFIRIIWGHILIQPGSAEETLLANWTEQHCGFLMTTMLVNEHVQERDKARGKHIGSYVWIISIRTKNQYPARGTVRWVESSLNRS